MADDKTGLVAGNKKDLEGIYYEQTPATVCIIIIHLLQYVLSFIRIFLEVDL
jgi:hypothetical protein